MEESKKEKVLEKVNHEIADMVAVAAAKTVTAHDSKENDLALFDAFIKKTEDQE